MQFKKTSVRLFVILFPCFGFAQTTYLPQGDKQNILLDRMEIKLQKDPVLNFSKTKPYSRLQFTQNYRQIASALNGKVDSYNYLSLIKNNTEWFDDSLRIMSRKPVAKAFYKTPANL